jgi:hypothetical protein
MKSILLFSLICSFILLESCGKKKVLQTRYITYHANKSYTGTHDTAGLLANVYLQEVTDAIEFQLDMNGTDATKEYTLAIHEYDPNTTFGYNPTPKYVLGKIINNLPATKEIAETDFNTFTQDFKGYFIVQDPSNPSLDTSSLLIYGKIGSDW